MLHSEKAIAVESNGAAVGHGASLIESAEAHGTYFVQCFDKDGNLKWEDTAVNAVLAEGKNYVLDKAFAGSAFTAAWYVGIYNSGYSVVGTETYGAKGATENTNYSNGTRPAAAWNAASAGAKALSGSGASFTINGAGGTIAGCFMCTNSTKGDSTVSAGVNAMWSIGAFSGGNKTVASGDTLNVSYSTSL